MSDAPLAVLKKRERDGDPPPQPWRKKEKPLMPCRRSGERERELAQAKERDREGVNLLSCFTVLAKAHAAWVGLSVGEPRTFPCPEESAVSKMHLGLGGAPCSGHHAQTTGWLFRFASRNLT